MNSLRAFAAGRMDAPSAAALESHLLACDACWAVIEAAHAAHPLVRLLSGLGPERLARLKRQAADQTPEGGPPSPPQELAAHPRYQLIVLDILRQRAEAGGAVLAALHDIGLAARRATRVIVLDKGRIVGDGPPREVLTAERLAATFGVNVEIVELRDAPVVIPWSVTERR